MRKPKVYKINNTWIVEVWSPWSYETLQMVNNSWIDAITYAIWFASHYKSPLAQQYLYAASR